MCNTVLLRFARKPNSIDAVRAVANDHSSYIFEAEITEIKKLTAKQYDSFTNSFLSCRDWLAGKGGFKDNNIRKVIAVTAPERDVLYVDPSGSNYARYVGIKVR